MRPQSLFHGIQTGEIELGVEGLNAGYKADTTRLVATLLNSEKDPALVYQFSRKTADRIDEADNVLIERQFGITQADIMKSDGDIRAADDLLVVERLQGAHINSRRVFVEIYYEDQGVLFGYTIHADFGNKRQGKLADAEKLIITSYGGIFDVKTGKITSAQVRPFQLRVEPNRFIKKDKKGKIRSALIARPMQGDLITYSRDTASQKPKQAPLAISPLAKPAGPVIGNLLPTKTTALPVFSPVSSVAPLDLTKIGSFGGAANNATTRKTSTSTTTGGIANKPFDDSAEALFKAGEILQDHIINASINFYVLSRLIPVLGADGEGLISEDVVATATNDPANQRNRGASRVSHLLIDLDTMQDVTKARGSDIKRAHAEGRSFNFEGLIIVAAYTQSNGKKMRSHCKYSSHAENAAELAEVKAMLDPLLARENPDMEEIAQILNAWGNPRTRERVLSKASTVTVVREAPTRGNPPVRGQGPTTAEGSN